MDRDVALRIRELEDRMGDAEGLASEISNLYAQHFGLDDGFDEIEVSGVSSAFNRLLAEAEHCLKGASTP